MNVGAPNISACNYIKQTVTDLKGETDNNALVRDYTIPLSAMDELPRQEINKWT